VPDFDPDAMRWPGPDDDRLRALYLELGFTRLLDALQASAPAGPQTTNAEAVVKVAPTYQAVLTLDQLRQVAAACERAGKFAIDTETTSTESTRAALVGLSLAWRGNEAFYVPISHRYIGAPAQLPIAQVREVLKPLFESNAVGKTGHNIKFDEIVLRCHGFPPMQNIASDTMIASYLLDPENSHGLKDLARRELEVEMLTYDQVTQKTKGHQLAFDEVNIDDAVSYAAADADLSLRLSERLVPRLEAEGLLALMNDLELPLSRVLEDVEMAGVKVDVDKLAALSKQFEVELAALDATAKEQAGHDFNISSPRQLETILFDELKLPVIKKTKTSRSTDASVLEALADQHPLPATILEQRQLAKLKNTYIDTLPKLVHADTGRIHTSFNQSVAATGRLSSTDPNLQNIPIRTEIGRSIREAFVAEPGFLLVSADYSQIELRVLAHLAHDPVLIGAFRSGEDVHVRTAAEVFGVPTTGVTDEMRRRAKTINFGVIYGMGEVALAKRLGITRDEAAHFIAEYFKRYEHVKRFMQETIEGARAGQAVRTLMGRRRYLKDMNSSNRQLRAQAERIAGNTPIQGSAADILKLAMVKLAEPVVRGARMILTVHDELVFEVPEELVDEAKPRIRHAMQNVVQLDVPLTVDVGVGKNWAEAH
jgi:DNA polymerase I